MTVRRHVSGVRRRRGQPACPAPCLRPDATYTDADPLRRHVASGLRVKRPINSSGLIAGTTADIGPVLTGATNHGAGVVPATTLARYLSRLFDALNRCGPWPVGNLYGS